jgi:hypothetical protein
LGSNENGNGDVAGTTTVAENGPTVEPRISVDEGKLDPAQDLGSPGLGEDRAETLAQELIEPPVAEADQRDTTDGGSGAIERVATLTYEPGRRIGLRLMPRLDALDSEPWMKRAWYFLVAAGVLGLYAYLLSSYWAPAHPGINQNAYLVGGKFLAERGTTGIKPDEPLYYLGWMWNLVERNVNGQKEIWYYPKYPIGTSALYAACLKVSQWMYGTWDPGKVWTFWVNPVGMTLAMAAMFMFLRQVAGSFIGLMGMMVLACSQVVLSFAEQPLSHGPAMAAVCWGMYFLLRWWQTASWWRGILAGLCLGFAVTTRYTEGLLLIPIAAAMVAMVRYDVRETRWWTLGVWLAIAFVGLYFTYLSPVPTDRWYTPAMIATVGLIVGLIPVLRGEFAREIATDGEPLARPRFRRVLRFIPVPRDVDWFAHLAHWLRVLIAAALVWVIVRVQLPARADWPDYASGVVAVVLFKLIVVGLLVLGYLIPWSQPRRWVGTLWPAVAWSVPVGILLVFNQFTFDSFSGYDSTNESSAFTWRTFNDKWDDTVQQLYDYSIFLIPPLALAGMFMMFRWSWRTALLLTLWLIPGFVLYTAYYYGKQRPGMWYLRFFMTILPPMVIAAMWLLKSAFEGSRPGVGRGRGSVAMPIGVGALTFCSCAVGLMVSVPSMERDAAANWNLFTTCQRIANKIPITEVNGKRVLPVVFAEGRNNPNGPLCNMLQFSLDADLYPSDGFTARGANWRGDVDPNSPNPLQAARQDYQVKLLRGKTEQQMIAMQNKIMSDALNDGRGVYAVLQPSGAGVFKKFITAGFQMKLIDQWREPARVGIERSTGPLDPASRGMPFYPNRGAQTWQLYEITKKPIAPKPATRATTTPSTAPTKLIAAATPSTAPATQPVQPLAVPATQPATSPTTLPAK